jgi:hypothetical protein
MNLLPIKISHYFGRILLKKSDPVCCFLENLATGDWILAYCVHTSFLIQHRLALILPNPPSKGGNRIGSPPFEGGFRGIEQSFGISSEMCVHSRDISRKGFKGMAFGRNFLKILD